MASNDDSTQQTDITVLHEKILEPSDALTAERPAVAETHRPSSVTRVHVAVPSEAATKPPASEEWMPRTVPAHELVQALVGSMGAGSERNLAVTAEFNQAATDLLERMNLPASMVTPADETTITSAISEEDLVAVAPTPPPPRPAYKPPDVVPNAATPAYAVEPTPEEERLAKVGDPDAWIAHLQTQAKDATAPADKARWLHKIASVYEGIQKAPEQAYETLFEAFLLCPEDDALMASVDRVGKHVGRIQHLAETALRGRTTDNRELKIVLLGHLVYWYERVLGRLDEVDALITELESLDKTHPAVLRRAAMRASEHADVKSQREWLSRALTRTTRRAERVSLHLALASAYAGTPNALSHYEAAYGLDPTSLVALQGIEHLGREQRHFSQVQWCLERIFEVAPTSAERVAALVAQGTIHEVEYLDRKVASQIFERVLELDPGHPQALSALERCYHALRDWPRLVTVLRMRADRTYDNTTKVEILDLTASVQETKLNDASAALETWRAVLTLSPEHRPTLSNLARLYSKAKDWKNLVDVRGRLADLATVKRHGSSQLVQLGEFLEAEERVTEVDVLDGLHQRPGPLARLMFERAIRTDPTNPAAWEALGRAAAADGDHEVETDCLTQRVKYVESPRQRAAIYVELGTRHGLLNNEAEARSYYEKALEADPSNETAASAMLDVFSRNEKWPEASKLCDLLVNAAIRDGDATALFARLRLATRIGAALGDAERAMTAALSALDLRPSDEGARGDIVAICTQCKLQPTVLERGRAWLSRIEQDEHTTSATVLLGLAEVHLADDNPDSAVSLLERALELARPSGLARLRGDEPSSAILDALARGYLAQGDFARCCKLKVDLARDATSDDERFTLLCEAGEIWARRAEELDKAALVFEEARSIRPLDHWLLHTLMWLYGERHRWAELAHVLGDIAQIQESPARKAKSVFALAQVVLEKVNDPRRAVEHFDEVLDLDTSRLDAFEQIVRILTERKDWPSLERAYRKMIARLRATANAQHAALEFALFHQLGLIYRDRLEDAASAVDALTFAAKLRPDDVEVRKMVTELLVVTDNLDNAITRTREHVNNTPFDPEVYAELYDLFLRQRAFDEAWCVADVLVQMRPLTAEQLRFHDEYGPGYAGPSRPRASGVLSASAWSQHVLHADLDRTLTTLLASLTPAVARLRQNQVHPDTIKRFSALDSALFETIRTTFQDTASVLQMSAPELLVGDARASVPFVAAFVPFGALYVNAKAIEAQTDTLPYIVGKRMAERSPELAARTFFPVVSDLTTLLGIAIRIGRQQAQAEIGATTFETALSSILTQGERETVRAIVRKATLEAGMADVKRWADAADLSSTRVGLLLCGSVGIARKAILAEPLLPSDLAPREKTSALYKFAISDHYFALRRAIGVAVDA